MSSSDLKSQKKAVRKHFLQVRSNISDQEKNKANQRIFESVIELDQFKSAETIHIYASMEERNEVDTFHLIEYSLEAGKKVLVPVMQKDAKLIHCEIDSINSFEKNSWGVPEPIDQTPAESCNPDVIFVPMVAGDLEKNRIGYGKGYYDRFLESVSGTKIGLLFEKQLSTKNLPTGPFDVALDLLITENQTIV